MPGNRVWSSSRNDEFGSVTRYESESFADFNIHVLSKGLRQVEKDFNSLFSSSNLNVLPIISTGSSNPVTKTPCSVNMSAVESKFLQQLKEMLAQMKSLNTEVQTVEKEFIQLKKRPD